MWRTTPAGKKIPVDPMPVVGGNIIDVPDTDDSVAFLSREQIEELKATNGLAYQSHFVSCPDATAHRRR